MGTSKETSDSAKDLEKLIVKYLNALSHEVGKIFGGDGLSVLNPSTFIYRENDINQRLF